MAIGAADIAGTRLNELGYKIFLDRYALKDVARSTLTVGDTVIVVVDSQSGQREIGEIIGPYEWESGYILLEITRLRDEPFAVRAQHILLDSAAAARRILAELRAGADFAERALRAIGYNG